jgi:hypothetical protein
MKIKFLKICLLISLLLIDCNINSSTYACQNENDSTKNIIIVAGQSNALSWHTDISLLSKDSVDAKIGFYYHSGMPPSKGNATPFNGTSKGKWVTLKYQTQDPFIALDTNFFGPEMSLARKIYKAGNKISVIKCAYAGTNLANDWNKNSTTGNLLYSQIMKQIDSALLQIHKSGYKTKVVGFFWMQGESDAENSSYAANYLSNIKKFIYNVRTDLGNPEMPFILGRIGIKSAYTYKETVRTAQVNITKQGSNVKWVDTDDFSVGSDNIHYLTSGILTLGERMADAWLNLQATDVKNYNAEKPNSFLLKQNYPNPFNPSTNISFILPFDCNVKLVIYNIAGQMVKNEISGFYKAGNYNYEFNAGSLPSGVYFYSLSAVDVNNQKVYKDTQKMILIK